MNDTNNASNTDIISSISQKLQNGSEDGDSNEIMLTKTFMDFHNHNSFIAVLIIMSLFLVITISTTGLVLAFCRKKNTVFALQKSEQESEYELDDMDENTDTEMCEEDGLTPKKAKKSRTFPNLKTEEFPSSPSRTPLVNKPNQFYSSNSDDMLLLSETLDSNGIVRKIHRSNTISIFPIVDSKVQSDTKLDSMFTTTALINHQQTSNPSISISIDDNFDYELPDGTLEFLDIHSITKDDNAKYINV